MLIDPINMKIRLITILNQEHKNSQNQIPARNNPNTGKQKETPVQIHNQSFKKGTKTRHPQFHHTQFSISIQTFSQTDQIQEPKPNYLQTHILLRKKQGS